MEKGMLNLCKEISDRFESFFLAKGLRRTRCDYYQVRWENEAVEFVFEHYEDTAVRFWFHDRRDEKVERFYLPAFLDLVVGHDHIVNRRVISREESEGQRLNGDLLMLEAAILPNFDRPIAGDFEWVAGYHLRVKFLERLEDFLLERFEQEDERLLPIEIKKRAGNPTWEEDAVALYKDIHGKEIE